MVKNIRKMVDVSVQLKVNPNWRNDPQFMAKSAPKLNEWLTEVPPDLRVNVSPDLNDPDPEIYNHFQGNLQVYYHLGRTMLHRPALAQGKTFDADGEWKVHMRLCSNSAKAICRLEEVIFRDYGMLGFQCMNRGVNFSIYTLLTGAMIHLVSHTFVQLSHYPDPRSENNSLSSFLVSGSGYLPIPGIQL